MSDKSSNPASPVDIDTGTYYDPGSTVLPVPSGDPEWHRVPRLGDSRYNRSGTSNMMQDQSRVRRGQNYQMERPANAFEGIFPFLSRSAEDSSRWYSNCQGFEDSDWAEQYPHLWEDNAGRTDMIRSILAVAGRDDNAHQVQAMLRLLSRFPAPENEDINSSYKLLNALTEFASSLIQVRMWREKTRQNIAINAMFSHFNQLPNDISFLQPSKTNPNVLEDVMPSPSDVDKVVAAIGSCVDVVRAAEDATVVLGDEWKRRFSVATPRPLPRSL